MSNTSGTFDVTLISTSIMGSDTLEMTGYITVKNKPSANISPAGNDTLCPGTSYLLTANSNSNLTHQWLKYGVEIPGATLATYTVTGSGNYKVRVTNLLTGCSKTSAGKKIFFTTIPSAITASGPTSFCNGDSVVLSVTSNPSFSYQWKRNGVLLSGENANSFSAKSSGTYRCIITDQYGCTKNSQSAQVSIICKESLGSSAHLVQEFDFSIYPVPASEFAKIKFPGNAKIGNAYFEIFNPSGNLVMKPVITESNENDNEYLIDVWKLAAGVYYVKGGNENSSVVRKLVVTSR